MASTESKVSVRVDGKVIGNPVFVNKFNNIRIFRILIAVKRLSEVVDTFYVNYSSELGVVVKDGDFVSVTGDIRTLNNRDTTFVIEGFIYAKSISLLDSEPESYTNDCIIEDAEVYKFDDLRKSLDGKSRDIAVYRISLYRGHGRYSYFSVTSWDNDALAIGNVKDTIKRVNLKCRLQSYTSKRSGRLYLCLITYSLDLLN